MIQSLYFDLHHTVTAEEIDAQNHVHNLRYLHWTLGAAHHHTAALGWDSAAALKCGLGWVVRDHEITYRAAALEGDQIVVRTWVSDVRKYAITRNYAITRPSDRTVLARASTRWVFVDLNQHRALSIPDDALRAIQVCERTPSMPWES